MSRFQRPADAEQRATSLELFYDLVFVFAITQVSHFLLSHLTLTGVAEAALVLLVVWWAWNYTTWVTNELDVGSTVVRLVLIGVMFASLLMAVAIPQAFGGRALLFVGSYVAIQIGRHTFLTFVVAPARTIERERAGRILVWFVAAGVFWIAGGFADGTLRAVLWIVALAVDYSAPLAVYWVPGKPRFSVHAWDVGVEHFAERFQLFMIIALGESIVVTGATTADLRLSFARAVAFALAFLGTCALWWLYFDYVARIAQHRLELAPERTRLARDAYTYLHVVMVAGIIVAAVGNEIAIAHPTDRLSGRQIAAVVAGPALYLLAHVLFRLRMAGTLSWKRLAGGVACVAVAGAAPFAPAVVLAALVVAVLVVVIGLEQYSGIRRRARGEPAPHEQLVQPPDLDRTAGGEPA